MYIYISIYICIYIRLLLPKHISDSRARTSSVLLLHPPEDFSLDLVHLRSLVLRSLVPYVVTAMEYTMKGTRQGTHRQDFVPDIHRREV